MIQKNCAQADLAQFSRMYRPGLLGHLGTVVGYFSEEVLGFFPRILVAVHAGTYDLRALLVEAEHAVHLVGGGVGVVALGRHDLKGKEAFQIRLVDGVDECIVAFRHFHIPLIFGADLLRLFDAGGRDRDGSGPCRGNLKIATVGEEVVVVQVADLGLLHGRGGLVVTRSTAQLLLQPKMLLCTSMVRMPFMKRKP